MVAHTTPEMEQEGGEKKEVKMEREQGKRERTRKMGRSQGEAQRRKGREGVLVNIFDPFKQEAEEGGSLGV